QSRRALSVLSAWEKKTNLYQMGCRVLMLGNLKLHNLMHPCVHSYVFLSNSLFYKCTHERRNPWGRWPLSSRKHITHPSSQAAMAGPIGIIMAIGVSAVFGWFLIL